MADEPQKPKLAPGMEGIPLPAVSTRTDDPDEPIGMTLRGMIPMGLPGSVGPTPRATRMLLNPETVAGVASLAPGVGTVGAGAIGGLTSLVRDAASGHVMDDPYGAATRAIAHAGINMIPGGIEAVAARKAMAPTTSTVLDAAGQIPGKTGIIARVLSALRPAATEAPAAAAPVVDELAGMELPGGIKLVSKEGLNALKQHSVDLENQITSKLTPAQMARTNWRAQSPQLTALDDLIAKVEPRVQQAAQQPANVLSAAGVPASTQAARVAADAAAKQAQRQATVGGMMQKLRAAMGLSSEARDAVGQQ